MKRTPHGRRLWTEEEYEVLDQAIERVRKGEIPNPRRAAAACLSELERIRQAALRANPRAHAGEPRTFLATYPQLLRRIPVAVRQRFGRRPDWSGREQAAAERYARAASRGEYPSPYAAAKACCTELEKLWRQGLGPGAPGVSPRTLQSVACRVLKLARALGVPSPWRKLDPAERAIVDLWVERYWRVQGANPPWCTVDLAVLMRDELRRRGYIRPARFCSNVLYAHVRKSRKERANPGSTRPENRS